MLKILQARLQQYVNRELPDVKAGFRKGGGTRDQNDNIHWIIAGFAIWLFIVHLKDGVERTGKGLTCK